MFLRQSEMSGVRTWVDCSLGMQRCDGTEAGYHAQASDIRQCGEVHITCWIFGTDAGGDQVGAASIINFDFKGFLTVWCVRTWCFHHQLHLIVEKQLDKPSLSRKYFSHLAMWCNVWRANGNSKKIKAAWADLNPEHANVCCRRLPPRPLKGRWCSTPKTEEAPLLISFLAFGSNVSNAWSSPGTCEHA